MAASNQDPKPAVVPFDDRTRRILELRELIRTGRYCPDPREVARAILEHARTAPAFDDAPAAPAFQPSRFIVRTAPAAPAQDRARAAS
ncbi:flagellar biosynthesis anti-sigma factor FlgM [Tepidiforma flava]|uniref:Flagellar biosynthesis anti-sigma factor FlgM n=1 Tax=Tepidiforma flava TaxID=3004094 RepID=A0ABY7M6X4_9CHLR|nr:flagellar biosynthesis anti-sigma factor FlgM [Tepidiforma flava]WBL36275.1 flagellar biosynthesis anti-sigma factor FlgM [Tepidiforma flava]